MNINGIEIAENGSVEGFISLFPTQGGMRLSFSLGTTAGVPYAGTNRVPVETLNHEWFTNRDRKTNQVFADGRLTSKFPLQIRYANLKKGTKAQAGKTVLFADVLGVSERPIVQDETARAFFAAFKSEKPGETPNTATENGDDNSDDQF